MRYAGAVEHLGRANVVGVKVPGFECAGSAAGPIVDEVPVSVRHQGDEVDRIEALDSSDSACVDALRVERAEQVVCERIATETGDVSRAGTEALRSNADVEAVSGQ